MRTVSGRARLGRDQKSASWGIDSSVFRRRAPCAGGAPSGRESGLGGARAWGHVRPSRHRGTSSSAWSLQGTTLQILRVAIVKRNGSDVLPLRKVESSFGVDSP